VGALKLKVQSNRPRSAGVLEYWSVGKRHEMAKDFINLVFHYSITPLLHFPIEQYARNREKVQFK
jgi:hypothetical protein